MISVLIHARENKKLSQLSCNQYFGDLEFELTVSRDSAAVGLGTLDCATPALGMAIAGGQRGNSITIDENCLCIVASRVIILVCKGSFSVHIFGTLNDIRSWSPLQCIVT